MKKSLLSEVRKMQKIAGILKEDVYEAEGGVTYLTITFESRGTLGKVDMASVPSQEEMGKKLINERSVYAKQHSIGGEELKDSYQICKYKNGWYSENMMEEEGTYYIDVNCPEFKAWEATFGDDWSASDIDEQAAQEIVDQCDMHNEIACY